jgi:3-hydroxymyristoyl/3-hydroxydecanoyl-(acyl carrier protein) dehydratase
MGSVREQIRSMLHVTSREGGFRAVFQVRADLQILPDHFRDAPLLPGVCMVQAVLLAGAEAAGASDLRLVRLKTAKMMQPILPGKEIIIEADTSSDAFGNISIKARLFGGERRRAEFSLVARPVAASVPAQEGIQL